MTVRPEEHLVCDMLGTVIRPGMLVAYARRAGNDHWLNVLHVVDVEIDADNEGAMGFVTGLIVKSSRVKPSRHGPSYQVEILPQRISVRHAVVVRS